MDIQILTPTKKIIKNGSIVIQRSDTVEFCISDLIYKICFFEPNEGDSALKFENDPSTSKMLTLKIGIKKETIESLFSKPIVLGNLVINNTKKELSLMFSAKSLDGEDKDICNILFCYTWYLEK